MTSDQAEAWGQYLADVDALCVAVAQHGILASYCFGVPLDGVIPALIIARQFGIEFVDGPRAAMHCDHGDQILVVVGYCDRGEDLIAYRGRQNVRTAALYVSDTRVPGLRPDAHGLVVSEPPRFPYDLDSPPRSMPPSEDLGGTVW